MIDKKSYAKSLALYAAFCIAILVNTARAQITVPAGYTDIQVPNDYATYDTELFNLLLNKKNLVDGRNHYSKKFATAFDAVLSQASLVKSKQDLIQLKKRLLSGPATKPRFLKQTATGKKYIYYEICQAHACNVSNLALLYEPQSKSLSERIYINGSYEYLGTPSESEKSLLAALKSESGK